MHEIGLAHALEGQIHRVMREREWSRVTVVSVKIGGMRPITPAAVELCVEEIFRGTPSAGARVEVATVPGRIGCNVCGVQTEVDEALPICLECGSRDVEILRGDEFVLDSLTGE